MAWFIAPILEEEEKVSVKDSIMSGLPSKEPNVGCRSRVVLDGYPMLPIVGQTKVYMLGGGDIDEEENKDTCGQGNKTKREVGDGSDGGDFVVVKGLLDSYVEETISLVGKWWRCQGPRQGVSHPRLLGLVR